MLCDLGNSEYIIHDVPNMFTDESGDVRIDPNELINGKRFDYIWYIKQDDQVYSAILNIYFKEAYISDTGCYVLVGEYDDWGNFFYFIRQPSGLPNTWTNEILNQRMSNASNNNQFGIVFKDYNIQYQKLNMIIGVLDYMYDANKL